MARKPVSLIMQLIRRSCVEQGGRDLTDLDLLQRFIGSRDQSAFDGLLRRHGPLVLDVCRNVLGNEDDAEDAFQATFLILAQKAGSIRKTAALASWLYGVAFRVALKARSQLGTRRRHESRPPLPTSSTTDDVTWSEVQQVIHAELNQLSERTRAPLVLCYLQGASQDQAAALLGVSKATVKKRLERGRSLLRARLVRRGLGPAAVLFAAAWPAAGAKAVVPPMLALSIAETAMKVAAGRSVAELVSTRVALLTEKVLKAMVLSKLKITTVVALSLVGLPLLGGWLLPLHTDSAAVAASNEPAIFAAQRDSDPRKADEAPARKDPLQGEWLNTDNKKVGRIGLGFDVRPSRTPETKSLHIRWMPPQAVVGGVGGVAGGVVGGVGGGAGGGGRQAGAPELPGGPGGGIGGLPGGPGGGIGGAIPPGAGRAATVSYQLMEKDGKKVMVLSLRGQEDLVVPYKLDGDTLVLDGGVFEVGGRGGRASFLKVELKGNWRRVDTALEAAFRKAFLGIDVEGFPIKIDNRTQRVMIAAHSMAVQPDGRIRFEDCAVACTPGSDDDAGAVSSTIIRSKYAVVQQTRPARNLADVGKNTIVTVDFADGVRLSLKK